MNTLIYKGAGSDSFTDFDDNKGIVKGYGSVFGNLDADAEIIQAGAFKKSLNENRSRIKYHYQHNLAWGGLGVFTELYEDMKGLPFVAQMAIEAQDVRDVYEKMKFGVIDENSVGFVPVKRTKNDKGNTVFTEVKLFEISAVSLAANPMATVEGVKSFSPEQAKSAQERIERIETMLKKAKISDDMGYALEAEILGLKSLIQSTKPSDDTLPQPETSEADLLNYLSNFKF